MMKSKFVSIYSIMHFLVDLACATLINFLVMQANGDASDLFVAVLLYNFFAFALQFPLGILADRINKNALFSAIGSLVVVLSFLASDYAIPACAIAGIGNAMFHLGGGIDVLSISNKKAKLSGIYVSTGALGIFLGGLPSASGIHIRITVIFALLLSTAILLWMSLKNKISFAPEKAYISALTKNEIIAIICLMITVCIRSYTGLILSFEWKENIFIAVLSVLAVVFGKMAGGILGDKMNFMKISKISLIAAAICFIFAFNSWFFGILAIAFFNMTMPITLTALSNILYNNKGAAFGLLTLALFIGAFPVFLGCGKSLFTPLGLFVITIISLLILCLGIRNYNIFMGENNAS